MKFNYQARTKEGEIQTGTIEASSYDAAVETLQRHGLAIVYLEAVSEVPFYARSLKIFQKVKTKELVMFYRQLSILFGSNIPLLESIKAVSDQVKNPYFKDILFEVENDIRGGELLSQALAKHPKVFSPFYINVIKAGEATGKLDEVLNYLADHAETEFLLAQKVKGAFSYPIFIISVFIIVGVLMLIFVVPQLTAVLIEAGAELPITTKILIGLSNFLKSWTWLLVLIIGGASYGFSRWLKTEKGRDTWDNFKLTIPILGPVFRKIYLARFAENFSTLLKGGLPILDALKISAQVVGNKVFERIIKKAAEQAKKGGEISEALEEDKKNFPPSVIQMIRVGEKTAKLDEMLERLAGFYQGEIDRTVANLTQLIEPLLIVILGGAVAFLVASILMPIYNITSGAGF